MANALLDDGFLTIANRENLERAGYEGDLRSLVELGTLHSELFMMVKGSSLDHLFTMMEKMEITFIEACEGTEFIASSFPVRMEWHSEDSDPTLIYFPLNFRYAVIYRIPAEDDGWERGDRLFAADARTVAALNRCLMNGNVSEKYLFARRRETLEDLSRRGEI